MSLMSSLSTDEPWRWRVPTAKLLKRLKAGSGAEAVSESEGHASQRGEKLTGKEKSSAIKRLYAWLPGAIIYV